MTSLELDTVTGELVPTETRTLFRTNDPVEVLAAARTVAEALKGALEDGQMIQRISGREHVKIDGWQTLGSMLGIAPYVVWSRPIEDGWEARAEARTADGRIVGAAEAMVTHKERNWRTSDEYALRSMAQTRAMSKALRGPLGFIITLAGKSATPAEEVGDTEAYGPPATETQLKGALSAATLIYDDPAAAGTLMLRLEQDAGDYLPRIVARTVMFVAAHRPGRQEGGSPEGMAGTGTEEPPENTPTPDGTPAEATETTETNGQVEGETPTAG